MTKYAGISFYVLMILGASFGVFLLLSGAAKPTPNIAEMFSGVGCVFLSVCGYIHCRD